MSGRSCVAWCAGLVGVLVLGGTVEAHRFYATLAEAEVDAERGALEVALRLDDHNLEDALRLVRGRDFVLTLDAEGERLARDYVAEHFVVATPTGERLELQWVGWEWTPGRAWLYFEFAVPPATTLTLANTLFLELSDRQVNTVNLKRGDTRRTLTFSRGRSPSSFNTP